MSGDIYLVAPGGRPGDIFLDIRNPSISNYVFTGRVVATDGTARDGLTITVFERRSLVDDVVLATARTDARGGYRAEFSLPTSTGWDVFVRAEDEEEDESVDSVLLSDLEAGTHTVDLVLGTDTYQGRSEWDRIAAKLQPLLGSTLPKDVPPSRLEWLAKRADVFPLHLAAYVQAHRLADGRMVKPESCYAFLRAGLPADLRGLLRAGETAWENALRNAWSRDILPLPEDGTAEDMDEEVAVEMAAMRAILVDAAVAIPVSGVNQRVIFDTAGLSDIQQRTFATLVLDHEGTAEEFWTAVAGSSLSGQVDLLKFTVQAATLVGTHVDTLEALQAERTATPSLTVAEMAEWSVTDWDNMLVARSVTPPADIPGAGATQRQNYARGLFNILEDAYPSASLRASIDREVSPPSNTEFLVTFLSNNPDFDIVESTVGHYLAGATSPWTGIDPGDQAEARANLETLQRVYRLTPRIGRWETAKVLLEEGITSATQIVGSTRSEFVSRFQSLLPADVHGAAALAGATWDNAAKVHATVVAMASQLALAKTNADFVPVAMPGSEVFEGESETGLAELSAILGNLDYCACEHCRSVFSPAAYLADLLAFLGKRPAEESDSALAVLLARRPDLEHILLDCANTNTVLPYIDLVNELLEDFINGGLGATSKQTTWTAGELRLHPEHLDAAVYEGTTMTQTVHPWTLPFSLPTVEAETYLRHLGVPRHELMRRFAPKTPSNAFLDAMAADLLGLDATGFTIVAGTYEGNESEDDREYWGFEDESEDDGWVSLLANDLGEILLRGRLVLDELRELIDFDFIDPADELQIDWSESCALADADIDELDAPALDRIHRFVRLQRATKIPSRMLNVLLRDALGGTLDRTALLGLADIVRLRDRLRLGWDELATFWANVIDARDYEKEPRALYTRRFLGKDFGPVDPDFVPDGTALTGVGEITEARLPRVLAGLGIKEADYQRLVDSNLASNAFTFANFTALFRCVLFARALRLSIEDFVRLGDTTTGLTGLSPFTNPAASLAFAEQIAAIHASNFSVNELDWLLRHQWIGQDPLDEAAIGRGLEDLARAMNTIEAEVALLVDPDGQGLATNLPEVIVAENVETATEDAIEIVEKTSTLTLEQKNTFIEEKFAGILDVELAKDILVDDESEDWIDDVALRRAWLLGKVVGHLRRRALVLDTIARQFGLAATVAEALVDDVLTDPAGGDPPPALFEVFRLPFATEEQVAVGLTTTSHANMFAAWTKLAKAALVCSRFELRADQVTWYSGRGAWLDLDALPLNGVDADATFESWDRLRRALALRDLSRPNELAPAEIAETTTLADAIEILADHAGWNAADILAIAGVGFLGYTDADAPAVAEEQIPERLRVMVETADRLGVTPSVLFGWATVAPTMTQTAAIKAATRAKYGESRWPEVAKPLRDDIRERQRDALVDAVIAITPSFRTSNDVFEHLLIDVEMGHCMMTSRIKQAIASVQIFIHRVLLHLEVEDVVFDPEAIERWDWMKNYRVWEANRKVFLYPENWIEPELRKDKTPEFEELEATLMQGVLDQHRVEKALGGYLEKLARVANLEMISTYEHPTTKELWLLARTHATPHEWFVRRRFATGEWEAWEAVPHSIDSDAVVLVVNKGRLHLFWANEREVVIQHLEEVAFNFTVGHLEKSPDGWGKPTLSDPSSAVFLPEHDEYRLHFAIAGATIALWVLWQNKNALEGRIGVAAGFVFDPVEQRVEVVPNSFGGAFVEGNQVQIGSLALVNINTLKTNEYVALQPGYEFDGQRNVCFALSQGDDAIELSSSVTLVQGLLNLPLFDQASENRKPTFLHQANIWSPNWLSTFLPAIYDDRLRKYVLQPHRAIDPAEPSPVYIGHFEPLDYVACPEIEEVTPIERTRPRPGVQRVRDRVSERDPWGSAAPGQTPALATIDAVDNPNAGAYNQQGLLTKSKEVAQASLDILGDSEDYPANPQGLGLQMEALYHPFVRMMQEALATDGLLGLYAPSAHSPLFRQLHSLDPFDAMGLNTAVVHGELPVEEFDFDFGSPYAAYNWEIFYHVPMLLAGKLATEQRWDEAQRWYHLMFNPIELVGGESGPSRFWRIKPFFEQAGTLAKDQFEVMLGIGATADEQKAAIQAFAKQVAIWEANPFDPHAVARVRPGVYQRALLREYFDNLIAWADNLFRRDTIESITEATVLYVVVAQLLGDRPHEVPGPDAGTTKTFAELEAEGLDAFSNAAIALENWVLVPTKPVKKQGCGDEAPYQSWVSVPVVSHFWYFCYPPNPELLKYWDIVEDRLFKIRHCQNIDGVERQLPLFEPPIDPALLVQAAAAGVDIQSVLAELDSGLPPYRFRSVHARAMAFTNSLKSLGGALLSALEKQDAEELSRIRSGHELEMLARIRDVRNLQRDEAAAAIDAIERGMQSVEARKQYYTELLLEGLSDFEDRAFELSKKARIGRQVQQSHHLIASIVAAVPNLKIGLPPAVTFGGTHLANIFNAGAAAFGMIATEFEFHAGKASTLAGYHRRAQDWAQQLEQASHETGRMQKELIAAKIRLAIAERELDNHQLQIEHAQAVDEYMRSKFTNRELYDWMIGQLATLYFQTYQLAFDLAKRAERAYRHELAIPTSEAPIIKFGYWDSLRKGLLAGDKLGHDLERLDLAYMDRDVREFELRKTVSLAQLKPTALQTLQETGTCQFDLPEVIFDLDHPGHYLRRIRGIRLTIPAVVGPYTSLGAHLQLENHRIRMNSNLAGEEDGYAEEPNDERFKHASGAGRAIATSTAVQDGGVFNLDFKDERYLPFEYAGAISGWKLTLPSGVRQFDYRTIEDVIVHVDYTARYGGDEFRDAVQEEMITEINDMLEGQTLGQLIAVHEAFPNEWEQFFAVDGGNHVLTLPVTAEHFPYFVRRNGFGITQVDLVLVLQPGITGVTNIASDLDIQTDPENFVQTVGTAFMAASFQPDTSPANPGTWTLTVADSVIPAALETSEALDPTKLVGLVMIIRYSLT